MSLKVMLFFSQNWKSAGICVNTTCLPLRSWKNLSSVTLWALKPFLWRCILGALQQSSERTLLLQGFPNRTAGVALSLPYCWWLSSWFISGRSLWAAISPFPSTLWLSDNIQPSGSGCQRCHSSAVLAKMKTGTRCYSHSC